MAVKKRTPGTEGKETKCTHSVALAVVCVDWRMHHPQSNFFHVLYTYLNAEKVYPITFPGPDILRKGRYDLDCVVHVIIQTLTVLERGGHYYTHKYVVAHEACAGHNVRMSEHLHDVCEAAHALNKVNTFSPQFIPLIASRENDDDYLWQINPAQK